MKNVSTRKRQLFLSTTVVLCGLHQLTPAQTPFSRQANGKFEPASQQKFPVLNNDKVPARESFDRTTADPEDQLDGHLLSRTYAKYGDNEHAIELLKKVIELNPGSAAAYNELGVLYCSLRQYDKAIDSFTIAIAYEAGNAAIRANLGTANYLVGNYARAIELLKSAVKQDPTLEIAQSNLGEILLKTGRYQDAIECLSRLTQTHRARDEAQLYNDIGVAHSYLKRFKEAIKYFHRAVELNDDFAMARFNLGAVSLTINDRTTAFDQYVALKGINPDLAKRLYAKFSESRMLVVKPARSSRETNSDLETGDDFNRNSIIVPQHVP